MRIAREGFRYIALLAGIGVVLALFSLTRPVSLFFFGLAAFVVFFFRDPTRTPPDGEHLIVSPGDGKVVYVGEGERDPSCRQVSIFLSVFNVHINRAPLSARVENVTYTPGKFLAAYNPDAGRRNEQNELALADGDYRVKVRQIAGVVARRIVCGAKKDDALARGERFGLIQFGSRMEIDLPGNALVRVKVGDRVRGGETVIAERV